MIRTELVSIEDKTRKDGVIITTYLVKTYSTDGFYIKQLETGNEYSEAIDIGEFNGSVYAPKFYTYEETNKTIEESN